MKRSYVGLYSSPIGERSYYLLSNRILCGVEPDVTNLVKGLDEVELFVYEKEARKASLDSKDVNAQAQETQQMCITVKYKIDQTKALDRSKDGRKINANIKDLELISVQVEIEADQTKKITSLSLENNKLNIPQRVEKIRRVG